MSLRAQIRDAIDEVSPPAPGLDDKVVAYILADRPARKVMARGRQRRVLHAPLALVAAVLVVLLMGGLVLGGRIWRDMHAPLPAHRINQAELKRLEARPLLPLVVMSADGQCPAGPFSPNPWGALWFGSGSTHASVWATGTYHSPWGVWIETALFVAPDASGLFLVRGRDLKTTEPVEFVVEAQLSASDMLHSGTTHALPAGKAGARDVVNGLTVNPHQEVVMDASAPTDTTGGPKPPGWDVIVGSPNAASGCVQFQIDHGDSTETFVIGY